MTLSIPAARAIIAGASDIASTIAAVLDADTKATPGPWTVVPDDAPTEYLIESEYPRGYGSIVAEVRNMTTRDEADLIALYRTAAPLLARECRILDGLHREACDHVMRLQAEVNRLRALAAGGAG